MITLPGFSKNFCYELSIERIIDFGYTKHVIQVPLCKMKHSKSLHILKDALAAWRKRCVVYLIDHLRTAGGNFSEGLGIGKITIGFAEMGSTQMENWSFV